MYITLEADYAVRIVNCLAEQGSRLDAKNLAERTGVTLRFSLKILRKLVGSGIVRSFKGTQGGYELAKSPDQITLGEVIELVDGPITISRCVGAHDYACTRQKEDAQGCTNNPCKFNRTYTEVARMVRERLYQEHF